MTPRPPTRRLFAVFTLVSGLLGLLAVPSVAASFASVRGTGGILGGDPAVGPPEDQAPAPALQAKTSQWTDVPSGYWAKSAIDAVAGSKTWMRDFGLKTFKPDALETRALFAKAVVMAFAPDESRDPKLKFVDVSSDDPLEPYINVAAKLGWMLPLGTSFYPKDPVTTIQVHRALLWALGLDDVVAGANAIHTTDGYVFEHGASFGVRLLGNSLGLRYNHDQESLDVGPGSRLPRSEVAWSLYRAWVIENSESWRLSSAQAFKTIHLGPVPESFRPVVEFAMRFVGYPYIYAGEWDVKTPSGYCCGAQPRGGFDCSGLMWWVLRAPDGIYDNTKVRPYQGYILGERSSNDMAHAIPKAERLTFDQSKAGDLQFYDSNHDGTVDHVDLYLGWGWVLDSGSNGVTMIRVVDPDSWYRETFVWGRRLVPANTKS